MFQRHLISRTLHIGACGAAIFLCATNGGAEAEKASKAEKKACKVAYKTALEREQAGHLREARDLLLTCSKTTCGGVAKTCTAKSAAISADLPSIVPVVTDDAGSALVDVQVKMDGELLTSKLDGRAISVDPGMHEFSFLTEAGTSTQKVMVAQGQRNRTIAVALHSDKRGQKRTLAASVTPTAGDTSAQREEPSAEKTTAKAESEAAPANEPAPEAATTETASEGKRGGPGALPFIVGGVGVLAVGAGAAMTVWGRKDNDLLSGCTPNCQQKSVDHVRNLYTASSITIGAGVVALGVATYLFATSGSKEKAPAKTATYSFDVAPTPAGAFASVSGAF